MREKNVSENRKKYLRKMKKERLITLLSQIILLVLIVTLWEFAADKGWIDSFITSKPSRIVSTLINLSSNGLGTHVGITCLETIIGFLAGTALGTIIAIILWYSKFIARVIEPFLVVLNSLPKVSLGPVIIIWVGAGMPAIIVMALAISLSF